VGEAGTLAGMASSDLGGVVLLGLSTLFSRISGVFMEMGLPLSVMLLRRGVRGSGLVNPDTLS
jgi:hypothetical protein